MIHSKRRLKRWLYFANDNNFCFAVSRSRVTPFQGYVNLKKIAQSKNTKKKTTRSRFQPVQLDRIRFTLFSSN